MTIQGFIGEHSADFDTYEVRPDWHGNRKARERFNKLLER